MIDVTSGAVVFDDKLSMSAGTPLEKVKLIPGAKIVPSIPGRTQLSLGAHSAQRKSWGVGAIYLGAKLNQVGLVCLTAEGVDGAAWSLENEERRKIVHDEFVNDLCSKNNNRDRSAQFLVYQFTWGKVSSILDIKGVQALILVEYLN